MILSRSDEVGCPLLPYSLSSSFLSIPQLNEQVYPWQYFGMLMLFSGLVAGDALGHKPGKKSEKPPKKNKAD